MIDLPENDPVVPLRQMYQSNFSRLVFDMEVISDKHKDPYEVIMLCFTDPKTFPLFFENNPKTGVTFETVKKLCLLLGYKQELALRKNREELFRKIYSDPRRKSSCSRDINKSISSKA